MDTVEVRADASSFGRVARSLDEESDGEHLRKDLVEGFRAALEPAVDEVRGALMQMASGGLAHAGEPLRLAVAQHVVVSVGRRSAAIRALKTGMPRGFWNAPKRLNQRQFRHRVYGRDVWVTQVGAPGWFDDTLQRNQTRYRVAARRALDDMADRIGRKG